MHLLQQQLVLHLQVLVLALQDALDVGVLREFLRSGRVSADLFLVEISGDVESEWAARRVFHGLDGADAELLLLLLLHRTHRNVVRKTQLRGVTAVAARRAEGWMKRVVALEAGIFVAVLCFIRGALLVLSEHAADVISNYYN